LKILTIENLLLIIILFFYVVLKTEILITLFWDNRRDPKALELALSELL
jgi:hypothetical protein